VRQLVDDAEPGIRILAEVIQAVADRERAARPTLALVAGESIVRMPFVDFAHGLGKCPSCGLPVDNRDVTRRIWDDPIPGHRPLAVNMEHKRCGTIFTIEFDR
jgi:hypothetical protein